jgi:hypothetical protein
MVSPIDYTMNVLNPIEGYLQGLKFGEGILSARQQRAATEQDMRIQQATFEEQQRARQEARAQAARAQAQAEAGRQALFDYFDKQESRTATPNDLRRAILQFPGMADQFQAVANSFSEERLGNEQRFGKQLSFALARGQTDAARGLLQERLDAATASGDDQTAATYQAQLQQLDASPEGLLMQTLMPLAATMDTEDFNRFYETALGRGEEDVPADYQNLVLRANAAGLAEGSPERREFFRTGGASLGENFRPATAEEAAQYGATGGQIDTTSGRFYPINPPTNMTVRTTPEGGIELVQGPGAGAAFREQETKDIVYATRAEGALADLEPVANELANLTPRLFEYVPLGQGRQFQSPEYQRANVAAMEFLAAILRKDTGAAITQQEIEIYGQTYLPQPGDSPQVLEQKTRARRRAIDALRAPMSEAAQGAVAGALDGGIPQGFLTNESVRAAAERAGVTPQQMWAVMTEEQRARYGE